MSKELTKLKDKAWSLYSEYYRLKHADNNGMVTCYTCGKKAHYKDGMQVGHLLDGRSNSILFEEDACRIQCYACNCCRNGFKEEYIPKYIDEMGREKYEEMKRLKHKSRKFSVSELKEMIEFYKNEIKELK